jgi:hypothetical protein
MRSEKKSAKAKLLLEKKLGHEPTEKEIQLFGELVKEAHRTYVLHIYVPLIIFTLLFSIFVAIFLCGRERVKEAKSTVEAFRAEAAEAYGIELNDGETLEFVHSEKGLISSDFVVVDRGLFHDNVPYNDTLGFVNRYGDLPEIRTLSNYAFVEGLSILFGFYTLLMLIPVIKGMHKRRHEGREH